MAELGCFASMPIFSTTIPLACDEPPKGLHLYFEPMFAFFVVLVRPEFVATPSDELTGAPDSTGF